MKQYALLVGVDTYRDPQIRDLSYSVADAFSLNAVFEDLDYQTKVLANPTRLQLITAIRECNNLLRAGDKFFFYFAGHGWTTVGGAHLLFCSDDVYDPNGNFNAGLSFDGLKIETIRNGYDRVFVLDACRNHFREGVRDVVDNTTRNLRPISELLEDGGRQNDVGSLAVIRSCSQNEHAIEIVAEQHGLFTLAMRNVLRAAIRDGQRLFWGTEFCGEIIAEMNGIAAQHEIRSNQTPEFAMAGAPQLLVPGNPRSNEAPVYYSCPICGKNNLITETFNCKKCNTDYLCLSHKSSEVGLCEKCCSSSVVSVVPESRDIKNVKCADIPVQTFKNATVHPECHLFDEELDYALVKGKDYVVQYEDADSPGFATAVITGIGKYHGERRVTFEIKKEDISATSPLKRIPCNNGKRNYSGELDVRLKGDKNSTEDFSVGSPQSKQGRKWRAWLQLLGSLLLLVALLAPIDWSGILSFNSDFDKGENQFSDSYENVTSPGWGFNPTPCKAPDYVDGERYKDGDCRTFTLPVKAKYPDGVHSVKMEMVYVAPGEFNMGSEYAILGVAPIHPVKITKGYWIAKYPVTQAQWVTLIAYSKLKLKNDGQWFCSVGGGKDYVKGLDTSDFPMESISWNDCDALVKALNSNETFSVEWMIPTEAQWEFAAKGGNKSKGYKFSGCDDIDMVGWYKNNSGGRTHSVLEKVKGNELGIVGMSGNVWEWCRDTYDSVYYQQCKVKGMVEDPCNVAASGDYRVLRGGSWFSNAGSCRSAYRGKFSPGYRCHDFGFRLACSAGSREEVSDSANKKKSTAELVKDARNAFVARDWKAGFDIATNISMNAISDSYVTYHVGYCYSPTCGTDYPKEKDYEKAYKWFKYTAELEEKKGDGIVQCILGDMEKNGQGCVTNIDNAVAWYRISAERKYGRGCYELGKCYEDNIVEDTNDNLVAARNWYFKAKELKYDRAKEAYERVLSKLKENAVPNAMDAKKEPAELVKEAYNAFVAEDWKTVFDIATNISMNAISNSYVTWCVGCCYSPACGIGYLKEKDYEKAYKWFKYTAELEEKKGDGIVQCILGDMEKNGQGCAANIDNAVAWYRISAERKYGSGCYKLGKCYEDDIVADTNDNLVAATNWYYKAMSLEYESAKEAYERVLKEIKERETAKGACLSVKIAEQEDWTYFKFSIKPISEMNIIPKDVVVLLDCSGSMGIPRLNNCVANIEKNLRSCMNPGDRFNLAEYHGDDNCSYVFNSWQQCTEESYEKASKWMNSLSPYGRGNVLGAVESIFKLSRDSKRPLIVLVITDKISDNQADETLSRKLSSFTKHNDGSVSVYLYCCSKRFHNRTLVDVFTCVNGGECLFSNSRLTSTSADDLHSLFIRFRNPILAGLHPVFTDDTKTELISTNMRNFYLNEVVDVIGRVPRGTKDVSFSIKGYDGKDMHELFFKCDLSNGESDKSILDFWKDAQTFLRVGCLQKANQNVVAVEVDHNKVNPVKRVQLWEGGPYWADRNIGAEKPWDSGYYFWWGDPVGYKYKDEKWEGAGRWVPNAFLLEKTICKKNISELCNKGYIELYEKGWFTDKYILTSMYDAAHVQLGGVWRMPTDNECLELCKKCTWDLMKTNGVYGWVVRGKDDYSSKSIFLPLAGIGDEKTLHDVTYGGWYWSSVPSSNEYEYWGEERSLGAMCLYFNLNRKQMPNILSQGRYNRLPIRPVQGFTK